jgi:hypothetical protein
MKHHTLITTLAALLSTGAAHAHEGHGLPGISHWHSTDVLGFIAVAALVVGFIWFKGRK